MVETHHMLEARDEDGQVLAKISQRAQYSALRRAVLAVGSSSDLLPLTNLEDDSNMSSHIDSKATWGRTPLHYAASMCNPDVVRVLCDKGTDVCQCDDDSSTPIMRAIDGVMLQEADAAPTLRLFADADLERCLKCVDILLVQENTPRHARKQLVSKKRGGKESHPSGHSHLRLLHRVSLRGGYRRRLVVSRPAPATDHPQGVGQQVLEDHCPLRSRRETRLTHCSPRSVV